MKRAIILTIVMTVCMTLPASSVNAGPGRFSYDTGSLIVSTSGLSFRTGPVTYGNVSGTSFSAFLRDPYSERMGTTSMAGFGVSGRKRAASVHWNGLSLLMIPGPEREMSLSYVSKYADAAVLWKSVKEKRKDIINEWERKNLENVTAAAITLRYSPYIEVTDAVSYSPEAGLRNYVRGKASCGPFSFSWTEGETLSQTSRWTRGIAFDFNSHVLRSFLRIRYEDETVYSERFTPYEGSIGWAVDLGAVSIGTRRSTGFARDAERTHRDTFFIETEKLDLSLSTDLKAGCRVKGETLSLGVREGGVWMRLSVVPGRFVILSEEGKLSFEITVEFPDE